MKTHQNLFCSLCINKFEHTIFGFPVEFPVFPFHFIALGAFLIIIVTFGILLQFLHKVAPFEWLLHRKILYPIRRKWLHPIFTWTLHLTFGELILVWMYFALNVIWGAYGFLLARSRPWSRIGIAVYFSPIAAVTSQLLILNFTFILIPAIRNSILKIIFAQSFERGLVYHRLLSLYSMVILILHAVTYITWTSLDSTTTWKYSFTWKWYGHGNVLFGFVSFCFLIPLTLLSNPEFRRRFYEIFFASHHIFAIFGLIAASMHNYSVAVFVAFGFILYILDIVIRIFQIARPAKIISLKHGHANTTIVEVEKRNFTFEAGQFIFICIPKISWVQFHPFTITSAPQSNGRFTLHIKAVTKGQWCDKLLNLAKDYDGKPLSCRIEGPYGIPTIYAQHYEVLLFCSGGIGVAPNISHLQNLIKPKEEGRLIPQKIYFNWTSSDAAQFSNFKEVLLHIKETAPNVEITLHSSRGFTSSSSLEDVGFPIEKGRPNYREILTRIKEENPKCKFIGVFTCGTEEMMNAVEKAVYQENGCKQRIHFHKEEYIF